MIVTTVGAMMEFRDRWSGEFFSECGGLCNRIQSDSRVLEEPAYLYVSPDRIVFTTVEGDDNGVLGSSFIAVFKAGS
jgi:hypothetical protein